jgi:hypothetical protein
MLGLPLKQPRVKPCTIHMLGDNPRMLWARFGAATWQPYSPRKTERTPRAAIFHAFVKCQFGP